MKFKHIITIGAAITLSSSAVAKFESQTREVGPQGFRFFNQHLTIKPYIDLSYTYDSNIDTTHDATDDSIFAVMPGADFHWFGDKWVLAGNIWYRYRAYAENNDNMGENSYGEALAYEYRSSARNEKGWSLLLDERYAFQNQSDQLSHSDGRGIWRDRETIDASAVFERRFTERLHSDVSLQYNSIDYKNDTDTDYAPLYGWDEYAIGMEAGYGFSPWTDVLIAGGYNRYTQDTDGYDKQSLSKTYSRHSNAYNIQAGIGTWATERITYRALMGCSWLDYGGHGSADKGWTYTLSANWRAAQRFQVSAIGSSYYEPSERYLGQAVKIYSMSGGISYLTMGDRLNLTANLTWRLEQNVYSDSSYSSRQDYDEHILQARLGASYILNRWMSIYASVIWEEEWSDNSNDEYNYDRFRGTIGMKFHY